MTVLDHFQIQYSSTVIEDYPDPPMNDPTQVGQSGFVVDKKDTTRKKRLN
jgi:hypothetical protein